MSVILPYSQICDGKTHISSLVMTLPKMSSHVDPSLKKCEWSASMPFVVIYQLPWHLSTTDLLVACTLMNNVLYKILYKDLISSKFFYSPTDAQVNCLTNNFKIYIKIGIKTAPTCFGAVTPSSRRTLLELAKVTVVKIAN
jgi:hypothetical protein